MIGISRLTAAWAARRQPEPVARPPRSEEACPGELAGRGCTCRPGNAGPSCTRETMAMALRDRYGCNDPETCFVHHRLLNGWE